MTRLRKLDASATSKATVMALMFGIVGALACFIFLSKGMIKDITAPRLIFFISYWYFSCVGASGRT